MNELEHRLACLLRTPPVLEDPFLKPQPIPQELPYKRPEKPILPGKRHHSIHLIFEKKYIYLQIKSTRKEMKKSKYLHYQIFCVETSKFEASGVQ